MTNAKQRLKNNKSIIRLSLPFLFCAQQNEIRARTRRGMIVLSRSCNIVNCMLKIIEVTTGVTVHDELNTSFSFHEELVQRITVHGFQSNHDSRLEEKNKPFHISRKKKIRPFTKYENTLYHHNECGKFSDSFTFLHFSEADGKSRRKMVVNSQQIWSDCYHRNTRNSDMQCHSRNYKLDIHGMPQLTKQKLNLSLRKI